MGRRSLARSLQDKLVRVGKTGGCEGEVIGSSER